MYLAMDDTGIVLSEIVDGVKDSPNQHLVIEGGPPDASERGHGDGVADVVVERWHSNDELVARIDELWRDRLQPFEDNLQAKRHAPRHRAPVLAGPDPGWANDATRLICRLRAVVGELAYESTTSARHRYLGSEKNLVDIQDTVRDFRTAGAGARPLALQAWFMSRALGSVKVDSV